MSPTILRNLALAFLLLCCGFVAGAAQQRDAGGRGLDPELLRQYLGPQEWHEVGDADVRAYATPGWERDAARVVAAARESLPRVALELGVRAEEVLPIWIVIAAAGGRLALEAPSWSAAIARPHRHLIVLSGPALHTTRLNLRETVAHEVAHLVVHARLGDEAWMPRWLHEGLAVHFSNYSRLRDRFVSWGRGPVRLDELENVFPASPARARLAYLESHAAVRRLLQSGPIAPLLDRLARGEEFEDAFLAVYGLSVDAFAESVFQEVSRRWRYLSLLTSGVTLFGMMTLLFLAASLRKLLRNRRRRREWAAEEAALELLRDERDA
ncbi:MAG: hypothetical protein JSW67_05995 [Candidatus Latescibacterota bacterium]|nr:MAG: hypothetical protein JSW67_05995 [Candidatus Latescibacterota bacterium]